MPGIAGGSFNFSFERMLRDASDKLAEEYSRTEAIWATGQPIGTVEVIEDENGMSYTVNASRELLLDLGLVEPTWEERAAAKLARISIDKEYNKPSNRLRRAIRTCRNKVGMWIGYDLCDQEHCYGCEDD